MFDTLPLQNKLLKMEEFNLHKISISDFISKNDSISTHEKED